MTFREAYHTFCEFLRNKMVYDSELKDAMRIYMDKVDDLIGENAELSVNLSRVKKKLANEKRLHWKYFNELRNLKTKEAKHEENNTCL